MDMFVFSLFFFFKQKTAYEMRISDWSSDVCSSDLRRGAVGGDPGLPVCPDLRRDDHADPAGQRRRRDLVAGAQAADLASPGLLMVSGRPVPGGGRRILGAPQQAVTRRPELGRT